MYENMMNNSGANGWMHGGMGAWPVLAAIAAVVILIVLFKLLKK